METEKHVSAWASTTHAENTGLNAQTLLVDWVTASFRTATNLQQILHFLGIENHENLEIIHGARYGFAGYQVSYKLGAMEFMHNESEEKWLLNFSGQACREYELISNYDFVTFFALLANLFVTYTRLDIAIDDYDNIYNVNTVRQAVYNKQCVTRLKEWGNSTRGDISTGNDILTMDNFYLGSSSSRYFINVYDKKMERAAKGLAVDVDSWTRTEVRFKNEYAEQFVRMILENSDDLGSNLFAFLNEKVVFLKRDLIKDGINKSRLSKDINNHARWWRKFLNTTKKLKLTVYKPDLPLLASKGWLLHQVSTTLALFNMYIDNDLEYEDFIRQLVVTGLDKMEKKHLKRLYHQKMLDHELAEGEFNGHWYRNTVVPMQNKIVDLSTKKSKENHKEKVMDIYWETVSEQQKNSPINC